jgi:hypothetical protein
MLTQVFGNDPFEMTRRLVEADGDFDRLRPQDRVLIKPNIVVSRHDWAGVNTDPRVVEALVMLLKEKGIDRIIVGDGAGMGHSTTRAFKLCEYDRMSRQYGFELLDLEKDRFITCQVPIDGPFERLDIYCRSACRCHASIRKSFGRGGKMRCGAARLRHCNSDLPPHGPDHFRTGSKSVEIKKKATAFSFICFSGPNG